MRSFPNQPFSSKNFALLKSFRNFALCNKVIFSYLFMRKADLINKIADKTGIPKNDVLVVVESFFREVKESLKQGENVYVRGFGSFIVKKRRQKIGRIIKRNEAIVIPEHFIPAFKPAKTFMEKVKQSLSAKQK